MPVARSEFAVRYYRWALEDARREVQERFPLLRSIRSSLVMRALAFFESFAGDDRMRVATAMVKRFHRPAVALTGDAWGPDEEAIEAQYMEAVRIRTPEEEPYIHAMLHEPATSKVDRSRLLREVRAALAPVRGEGEKFSSTRDWRYETPIGPWQLVTLVDVGGRIHQLAYSDTIRGAGPRPLHEGLSITGWLGIGGGHTTWDRLTEADTPAAAESLGRICAHFLRAAPALVDGLAPE